MAAGVTDKLWEVSDIVEMLEEWEVAQASTALQFIVRNWAIGGGHYVQVVRRGQELDTVQGFASENEAMDWIRDKSQRWLIEQNQKLSIKP